MTAAIPSCEAIGVTHNYGHVAALSDVSFTLMEGRVTGLVGANGSGKSTLLRIMSGVQRPTAGTLRMYGTDISSSEAAVPGIGAATDGMGLWPNWKVRRTLDYVAALLGGDATLVERAIADAQLQDSTDKTVRKLSLGNRQRVSLAVALITGSRMVLLDEPMNGLDPEARQVTRDLILRLAAEGLTVLLSSHDLNDVEKLTDDLVVLQQGAVIYAGETSDFRAETAVAVLAVHGDVNAAHGTLAAAGMVCSRSTDGELVVFAHDGPAAVELLRDSSTPGEVVSERPATLEERFHGAQ